MIPHILDNVLFYIKKSSLKLNNDNNDGRINSIYNETQTIDIISNKYKCIIPESRCWYDICIIDNDIKYYINIKCTSLKHKNNDNISSKKGLFYSLTGKNDISINTWDTFIKNLKLYIKETDKDYYFIIINKDDIKKSYITSLKHLNKIVPNGNNLPFQSKWADNNIIIERSFIDYKNFVLNCLSKSLELRASAYIQWKDTFNEY